MASIEFSATLNTAQLEAAIKQSNKTVGDWAKGVEKAGGQADQGLNKMTKSFKDAITEQKALIKSIEKDIKDLQKAYDDATAGRAKQAAGGELRSARKSLAEEQGSLLGLQKQQIEANEQENSGINKLVGGIGKWVMGLFTVGAALKVTKSIIASTEGSAHKFEVVVAEATSGIGYFFKAIASGDWSNFSDGLVKAMKGAKDFVNAMEDIQNRTNEQKIKSAEISGQIAELRAGTFDRDIENNDKLITNLTAIIALQKQDYLVQAKIAADTYKETLKSVALNNSIDKDKLDNLIDEYTINKSIIELGEKYNEKQAALNTIQSLQPNAKVVPELEKEIAAMGAAGKAAGEMALKYGKVPIPLRTELAALKAEQIKLEGQAKIGSRFDEMRLATAEKLKITAEEDAKKKAIEDAKTENQIKTQTELLNKAIESGNATQIKAIAARIAELKKELEVREKIARQVIDTAAYEGFAPTVIGPGGIKVPSVLPKTTKPKAQKLWDDQQKEMTSLGPGSDAWAKKMQKAIADNDKTQIEALNKELKLRNEIVNAAADLVSQIGQQIGLDEKSMGLLNAGLNAFTALATGDIVGAAASMISGIISQIPSAASRFEAQIGHINQLLEEQARLIDLSERKGGTEELLKGDIELLKQKETAAKKEYERLLDQAKIHLDLLGWRQKKADEAEQAWKAVTDEIEAANQALDDFMTGGVTQNTISEIIAQGFQEGKTSVDDFADYMNQVLVDAVLDIFKAEMLGPAITEATSFIKTALEDKILTKEEKDAIDQKIKTIADANKEIWDGLTGSLNLGSDQNVGLSGGIQRQITEETGSELAGLFRRFADEQRVVKDYSILGVAHLVGIEANTMNTVLELQKANLKLDTVITNTNKVYAVGP